MLDNDRFDLILNVPEVAVLANGGDPAWRPIPELTRASDHRAVDDAAGAGFLATTRGDLQA